MLDYIHHMTLKRHFGKYILLFKMLYLLSKIIKIQISCPLKLHVNQLTMIYTGYHARDD